MTKLLQDKVIIVTGAGRGIGRDIALLCAAEGAKVVVNDPGVASDGSGTSAAPAEEVVEEIRKRGGTAVANFETVAEAIPASKIVKSATDHFGKLDGVVNNAGILRDMIFHKMSIEAFEAVIKVHLMGSFYVAHSAAKMGIIGLSRSIALDMAAFNVRSNCISPFAWTRMIGTIPADTDAQKARLERSKRMTPAKVAPMAVFLLSDAAQEAGITSQIFGVRMNEIMLFNANRPVRSVHNSEGWTLEAIAEHAVPSMKPYFTDLKRSPEYFTWDPV